MTRVVIDIPDNEYCTIKEMNLTLHTEMLKGSVKDWEKANTILNLLESVKSGTVLPKGDWIINPDTRTMKCSRCGAIENADRWLVEDMNYCHCCGAEMRGNKE